MKLLHVKYPHSPWRFGLLSILRRCSAVIYSLFDVATIVYGSFFVWFLLCCSILFVVSSFATIWLVRESALLKFYCLLNFMVLYFASYLQCIIVTFPVNTLLLFAYLVGRKE